MTQHVFKTTYEGKTTQVMLGWDRPLQGFFMVIPRSTAASEDTSDSGYLYCNLLDPDLSRGVSYSIEYFKTILEKLHIDVPEYVFSQINNDETCNRGNRFVRYWIESDRLFADEEGVVSEIELSESPHY
jgi:hypothetical protein